MDGLAKIPPKETSQSDNEKKIMDEMFGSVEIEPKKPIKESIKVASYAAFLFLLVANPWIDMAISKAPGMTTPFAIFGVKLLIFFLLFIIIYRYLS